MMAHWLDETLSRVCLSRVAVFGDFCLDAYWEIDALVEGEEELSVETALAVRRVRRQRYSLGGAGNVAANVSALGCGAVWAVGLVGADPFGGLLRQLLAEAGVDTAGMLTGPADWQTGVFGKPLIGGVEQNRMDFGGFNEMSEEAMGRLAAALDEAAGGSDAVILNQQVPAGVSSPAMIERINRVVERYAGRCVFIADSRHFGELYRGVVFKTNANEALRMLGRPRAVGERVDAREAADAAGALHARTGCAVFVTRGEAGMVVADGGAVREVPGVAISGPVDPVGAGDTAVSAIAAVLGGGGDVLTAAKFANLAAAVTVRKLHTTGTASPAELRAEFGDTRR